MTRHSRVLGFTVAEEMVPPRLRASAAFLPAIAAAFAVAVFVIDAFVAIDIAIAVLYVAVVIMSITFSSRRGVLAVAAACLALTVLAFSIQHWDEPIGNATARCTVSLLAIAITAYVALGIQASTQAVRNQARLLDLTHDAIFVRDMDDVITFWNRGAESLYGWRAGEALGAVSHDLLHSEFPMAREKITEQLLESGFWEGDIVHTRRDGSKVTVSSRWSLQRDRRGEPIATLETNTDIDERKRAQETLAEAQAELAHLSRVSTMGELTASIAHEVNQPLAAIVTRGEASLRWLGIEGPPFDRVKRGLERMIADAQRASGVVRRLRALSSKEGLRMAPLGINEAVEEAIPLMQREIGAQGVRLSLDLAGNLPPVNGDRLLLQLVVVNLGLNAIQAMASVEGRRDLTIRTQREDEDHVRVSVVDTGPGYDPSLEADLFNAFFTTKSDGMGMGLAISRSIVETHGGKIAASRNAEGGATFSFSLPLNMEAQS